MRILLITEFFPSDDRRIFTGGVETRTFYLSRQLSNKHQVQVISRRPNSVSATFFSLPSRVTFFFRAIIQGLQSEADIIEGSNLVSYLPAFITAKLKGIPAIAWYPDVFIGTWSKNFGLVGIIGELTERIIIKLPWDQFIALSNQTKKKLINAGVDKAKITVVHAGINRAEFTKVKTKKPKNLTIACVSRLVTYKRIQDLIVAFAHLKQRIPKAKLVIVGSGPQEKHLRQIAVTHDLTPSINWRKNISRRELIKLLRSSHVFSLPSLAEGFGLVTLEALAASIPYVNANTPISREVTHQGQGGLLFNPKDSFDLSQKILRLWDDKNFYQKKVIAGKKLLEHYSWEKMTQKTLAVYKTAIA